MTLNNLNHVYKVRTLKKTHVILADPEQHDNEFVPLPSSSRYNVLRCRTSRFKNSFVLAAVCLFNITAISFIKHILLYLSVLSVIVVVIIALFLTAGCSANYPLGAESKDAALF